MAEHADADESRSDQSNCGNAQPDADPVCYSFAHGPCILNVDIVSKDEAFAGRYSQSVSLCERATSRGVWNCLMNLSSIEPNL